MTCSFTLSTEQKVFIKSDMYNPVTLFGVLLFFEIIYVLAIQKIRATRHFEAEVSNFHLKKFWVPS